MFFLNTSKRLFGSDSIFNWRRSFNVTSILDNIVFDSFSYFSISTFMFFIEDMFDGFDVVEFSLLCLDNEIPWNILIKKYLISYVLYRNNNNIA